MEMLRCLEEIRAIAQNGLSYTEGPYDRERYQRLHEIYQELIAWATGPVPGGTPRPLPIEEGYRTPKADVRALVLQEGKVLLARERADGLWSLPGGWADVGKSPAENAAKEVEEETGYRVRCVRLLGVLDRDRHPHPKSAFHTYKMFFHCELTGGQSRNTLETDGVGFFPLDQLPPLSLPRVTEEQVRRMAALALNPVAPPAFD